MSEKDQAVGLLLKQHLRVSLLARRVVLRVTDEHGVAGLQGRVLNALEDQREKRIGNVGDCDQNLARPLRAEILGGGVRRVTELFDRAHHTGPRLERDTYVRSAHDA
jgi:hypothetical protein